VDVTFSAREDGQVDAHLVGNWRLFQDALDDSISSLPPRGVPGNGPSTYWIDHAEHGTVAAHDRRDDRPFTGGNITRLSVRGDRIVASYDFNEEDELGQEMPLADLLALLGEWRRRVVEAAANAKEPLPETYRRNPFR